MIAADGEANKNKNKQKIWWLVSYKFYKKYLQDLKYIVKEVYIFYLIFIGITSILILSVKRKRGVGLLNGQNPLSVVSYLSTVS